VGDADGVPWCDTCDRFYNPNSLTPEGACPKCGRIVAVPAAEAEATEDRGAPWHFKVLIAVTAVYLGYRLFQGIFWVAHHL
jgi:hypothetical protein